MRRCDFYLSKTVLQLAKTKWIRMSHFCWYWHYLMFWLTGRNGWRSNPLKKYFHNSHNQLNWSHFYAYLWSNCVSLNYMTWLHALFSLDHVILISKTFNVQPHCSNIFLWCKMWKVSCFKIGMNAHMILKCLKCINKAKAQRMFFNPLLKVQ